MRVVSGVPGVPGVRSMAPSPPRGVAGLPVRAPGARARRIAGVAVPSIRGRARAGRVSGRVMQNAPSARGAPTGRCGRCDPGVRPCRRYPVPRRTRAPPSRSVAVPHRRVASGRAGRDARIGAAARRFSDTRVRCVQRRTTGVARRATPDAPRRAPAARRGAVPAWAVVVRRACAAWDIGAATGEGVARVRRRARAELRRARCTKARRRHAHGALGSARSPHVGALHRRGSISMRIGTRLPAREASPRAG